MYANIYVHRLIYKRLSKDKIKHNSLLIRLEKKKSVTEKKYFPIIV